MHLPKGLRELYVIVPLLVLLGLSSLALQPLLLLEKQFDTGFTYRFKADS